MTTLKIPDMSCGHCVKAITEAITALDATATVTTDLQNHTVCVQSGVAESDITQALTQAGYPPAH
jgi:copper chaperone